MNWKDGIIEDCLIRPLRYFKDGRGWLTEVFRHDELAEAYYPAMGYLSLTHDGVARGPHEHVAQTDLFVFYDGKFRVHLWDNRPASPNYGVRQVIEAGGENPLTLIVPPGVVHGYRNISGRDALIFNCPNALYAGWQKKEPVDEIRHEDQADSIFEM